MKQVLNLFHVLPICLVEGCGLTLAIEASGPFGHVAVKLSISIILP